MKKIIIPILLIFMSCNSKATETTVYPFKGILIDVISSEHKMMIKHDEVPGYMMETIPPPSPPGRGPVLTYLM